MSTFISSAIAAGLLLTFLPTSANAGFGSNGWGGVQVWQTPDNEPAAQARREAQRPSGAWNSYGRMHHHHHHHRPRHHAM